MLLLCNLLSSNGCPAHLLHASLQAPVMIPNATCSSLLPWPQPTPGVRGAGMRCLVYRHERPQLLGGLYCHAGLFGVPPAAGRVKWHTHTRALSRACNRTLPSMPLPPCFPLVHASPFLPLPPCSIAFQVLTPSPLTSPCPCLAPLPLTHLPIPWPPFPHNPCTISIPPPPLKP